MNNRGTIIRNTILGLAYGDAWGWPMEFMPYYKIEALRLGFPSEAVITDDTQMSLYTIRAMLKQYNDYPSSALAAFVKNPSEANSNEIRKAFADELLVWMLDPDNVRAPGINCMETLTNLLAVDQSSKGMVTGLEGTNNWSKGCGANMRNSWLGLLPYSEDVVARLSVLQSSVTHNHPLALSSSALTALVVHGFVNDKIAHGQVFDYVLEKTNELINSDTGWAVEYSEGLRDLYDYLKGSRNMYSLALQSDESRDVCSFLGEGKVAEEALLLAIFAVDKYQDSPVDGLRRLAQTSGDSDSIAAIAGAFLGSATAAPIWPEEWFSRLEDRYSSELTETIDALTIINA